MPTPSFRFSFSFTDKIWQVAVDLVTGRLVAEVRNEERQSVQFELIDLDNGLSVGTYAIDGVDWWTTILRMVEPYLVLEQYTDPQNPTVKGVMVYDMGKGEVFAQVPQFQFSGMDGIELQGYDPKQPAVKKGVTLTGMSLTTQPLKRLINPVFYHPGSDSYKMVAEFLRIDQDQVGCEYYEDGDTIIISYYLRLGTKFERKLLVLQSEEEIYHEVIDSEVSGFASGGFFLLDNLLVFIENSTKINAIEL